MVSRRSTNWLRRLELSNAQLRAIVERALPGERLADSFPLSHGRHGLILASGERLQIQVFDSNAAATMAVAALRKLRAEIDLPIPQLRASDTEGNFAGLPYILLSVVEGEPLEQALPRINEGQRYELGRRLGNILYRVHRVACRQYGTLAGNDPLAANDERSYGMARLVDNLQRCLEVGLLDQPVADALQAWFDQEFNPAGRQAALVCGGLNPQTILVRSNQGVWSVGGLIGWEQALGWSPAWDHVTFLDAFDGSQFFSLRVGYGNGYDQATKRTYEQVREPALKPYRMLLTFQQMLEAYESGDQSAYEQLRDILIWMLG